jgi:flagellar motility protein MotE (MotC chaperone)
MSRLRSRVEKIEKHCGESRAVITILNKIQRASDKQLDNIIEDGQLQRMIERLNDQELDRLIELSEEMLTQDVSSRDDTI